MKPNKHVVSNVCRLTNIKGEQPTMSSHCHKGLTIATLEWDRGRGSLEVPFVHINKQTCRIQCVSAHKHQRGTAYYEFPLPQRTHYSNVRMG